MTDLELACSIARRAGALLREHFARRLAGDREVTHKGKVDLVTDADRESEALVVRALRDARPDDAVRAEEDHRDPSTDARRLWLVDPLDGTTNFAHTLPVFAVSIALHEGDRTTVGAIYAPIPDELFAAAAGQGASLNGRAIRVSGVRQLSDALCVTGFPYDRRDTDDDNTAEWRAFMKAGQGVRRMGAAALDLCSIACGRLDVFWEMRLAEWDVAAGALIVAEAGGHVTGYRGEPFDPFARRVLATNSHLHEQAMATLATVRS